ncbi:hypothetical protein [Qipengyuania mesophila]|uniref:hypothetical protein n=1 Tax=Qipengyuania mesophila TaxID=2867246 RepID=UPI003511013B
MTQREGRIADGLRLLVFLILAAALAVLQLDKASEQNGSVANLVPAGLGGFADAKVAASTLESDHAMVGTRLEELLKHRPMEAAHLSNFAVWAAEEDDPRAGPALSSAAKRGWRDRYTQLVVLAGAVTEGKVDVAAARLDALSRLRFDQEAVEIALAFLLKSEEGQAAVALRIAESEFLMRRFIAYANSHKPIEPGVISSFWQASKINPNLDCNIHYGLTISVLESGDPEYLPQVLPKRCAKHSPTDFGFSRKLIEVNEGLPFAWKMVRSPGLSIRPGEREGALTLSNSDPIRRIFARRYQVRNSGRYRLTISSVASGASSVSDGRAELSLDVHCITHEMENRRRIFHAEEEGVYLLYIPSLCPVQVFTAAVSRGSVENVKIELSEATLAVDSER